MTIGRLLVASAAVHFALSCSADEATGPAPAGGAAATGGSGGGGQPVAGSGGTGGMGGTGGAAGAGGGNTSPPRADGGRSPDAPRATDATAPPAAPSAAPFTCPAGPFPAPMPGPAQAVCADFAFNYTYNEGPTWIASQGAFYFTNFVQRAPTRGDIIKYTPGGGCEVFQRDVGCNGLAVAPDGALLAACHQSRSVVRFDPVTGAARTLASELDGQLLDTPNDLVAHRNGTIYFTNPPFELGPRPPGIGAGVFRIDPAGVLTRIYQGGPPNGIALSPDQRLLYALNGGIWDLDETGNASNRRPLFTGGDGMAVDCAGNLYARGIIFSAQGQTIGNFGAGTNLAFGGPDNKTLLVVGPARTVRAIPMNLPGLP